MKSCRVILSLGICLSMAASIFAADSGSGGQSDQGANSNDAGSAGGAAINLSRGGKHAHQHRGQGGGHARGHNPSKKQVMGLSDLTDKQKSQISAVYEANKSQFEDLHKQLRDLEGKEWEQIKGYLTPEQLQNLGVGAPAAGAAGSASGAKSDADSKSTK